MRGAHYQEDSWRVQQRIIPADAGSTYMNQNTENSYEDHPRGCGEHIFSICDSGSSEGSSPRMRGARQTRRVLLGIIGIIPADAGSTG